MNKVILLILLTILMISVAVPFIIRSLLWNRILKKLHKGHYDEVLALLHGKLYGLFFKTFDRDYNCLRVYLAKGDNKKIEAQTMHMLDKNISQYQAYQVASQTYFYYVDRNQKGMCEKLLDILKKYASEEEYEYDKLLFRIMIENKYEDIECVEELLHKKEMERIKKDQVKDQQVQIGILQYLLGLQYLYSKDLQKMKFYLKKANVNLKGTPYQKKVKQLLN